MASRFDRVRELIQHDYVAAAELHGGAVAAYLELATLPPVQRSPVPHAVGVTVDAGRTASD